MFFSRYEIASGFMSIEFYFIGDPEDIEATMERIRDAGFEVTDKRIVHGYSPSESMIYLSLKVLD